MNDGGCFRVGKRHAVRFTSRLLRRYVTPTEPRARHCQQQLRRSPLPLTSLPPPSQVRRKLRRASAGSIAEEVIKMRGRGRENL